MHIRRHERLTFTILRQTVDFPNGVEFEYLMQISDAHRTATTGRRFSNGSGRFSMIHEYENFIYETEMLAINK